MRGADRNRADGTQAVQEAEGEDEADRIAFQRRQRLGESRLFLRALHPAVRAEAPPRREEQLVGDERPARRRDHRAGQRQHAFMREQAAGEHHRLAFDPRAQEDGGQAVFGDQCLDAQPLIPICPNPNCHSTKACSSAASRNDSKRPDFPPCPAPMLVFSSSTLSSVLVERSLAAHFAGSQ
ncbi:hypothetical protein WR25_15376 [Diploscapter pachys]|uniref:Uncharacterized protein n=1 Tax=Diploscapter pachys TaxID=2018661 RepID=A0A2A2M494_9BILA|nr:hypothetical protein WR25_15376 [Diploscapter pachys]